jgi:hypothetical protein
MKKSLFTHSYQRNALVNQSTCFLSIFAIIICFISAENWRGRPYSKNEGVGHLIERKRKRELKRKWKRKRKTIGFLADDDA